MKFLNVKAHTLSLAVFLVSLFLALLSPAVISAAEVETNFFWNRGDILMKGLSPEETSHKESCPTSRRYGNRETQNEKSDYARILKECFKGSALPPEVKSFIDNLSENDISIFSGGFKTGGDDAKGVGRISCSHNVDVGDPGCTVYYNSIVSRNFTSNGMTANGEAVYIAQDGGDGRLYVNGGIMNTDDIELGNSGGKIIGKVAFVWEENSFYHVMDKEYKEAREQYIDSCNRNAADCASSKERAGGAFVQVWRTCVVATGSVDADVQNALNCLNQHGGIKLNAAKILKGIPGDPNKYDDNKNCGISMAGYILCPLMRFMSNAADTMFSFMKNLMLIAPLDPNTPAGKNAMAAWRIFVSIANVVFAILLLILIISQVTSFGISNYGAKKILPRLIIGALLVNISFYICIFAIDITNILGDSIQKVMIIINDEISKTSTSGIVLSPEMNQNTDDSSSWSGLTDALLSAGIVAGGVGATVAVVFLFIPIITSVILAAVVIVMTLFIRYGLVLVLTIISPIAFALYLLPNTQKWFVKWRTAFTSLLMLFPIVSAIFGLSTLAANIVMQIASAEHAQALALFALAIQAMPLAVTPIVLRNGGQMLGNIGSTINNNRLFGKARGMARDGQGVLNKKMQAGMMNSDSKLAKPFHFVQKQKAKNEQRANTANRKKAQYISDYLHRVEGSGGEKVGLWEKTKGAVANKLDRDYTPKTKGEKELAGMGLMDDTGTQNRALAYAVQTQHSILTDEVKAHSAVISGMDGDALVDAINNSPSSGNMPVDTKKMAALERLGNLSDADAQRRVLEQSGQNFSEQELLFGINSLAKGLAAHPSAKHAVASGQVNNREDFNKKVVEPNLTQGDFTVQKMTNLVKQDMANMRILHDALTSNQMSRQANTNLVNTSRQLMNNRQEFSKLNTETQNIITSMANHRVS